MERYKDIFDTIFARLSMGSSFQESPVGFVLGGQPGAGKSNLTKLLEEELEDDVVEINADEFRKYHPDYEQFQNEDDKTSQDKTAKFSSAATEYVLKEAISHRYNLIIEGTFRTSETPIKTLKLLNENNYEANVRVLIAPSKVSWASCEERYEKAISFKRWTPKEHHDLVVSKIADNLEEVLKSGVADNIQIYLRDFNNSIKLVFDSSKDRFSKKKINDFLKAENQEELTRLFKENIEKSPLTVTVDGKIHASKNFVDKIMDKIQKPVSKHREL